MTGAGDGAGRWCLCLCVGLAGAGASMGGREDAVGGRLEKQRAWSTAETRRLGWSLCWDSGRAGSQTNGAPKACNKLKELERLGPRKGVVSQTVKDVVQSLVDDDLVFKDKIGSSVFFWSLSSCAGNQLRHASSKLVADLASAKRRRSELVLQKEMLKKGREDSDEREAALNDLKAIEEKHKVLKEELERYADNDPANIDAMRTATEVAHVAANRWTDNIFALQHWCSRNFPEAKERLEHLYKEVGITDSLDYLD